MAGTLRLHPARLARGRVPALNALTRVAAQERTAIGGKDDRLLQLGKSHQGAIVGHIAERQTVLIAGANDLAVRREAAPASRRRPFRLIRRAYPALDVV